MEPDHSVLDANKEQSWEAEAVSPDSIYTFLLSKPTKDRHPEPPSPLRPQPIPLGCPSAECPVSCIELGLVI